MDEVTQQNAALVEEAAAAAQSLDEQTGRLRATVAVFQVDEGGAAKARPAEPVAIRPSAPVGKSPAAAMQDARVMPAPRAAVVSKPVRKPAAAAHAASPAATTAGADDWETF